MVVFSVLVDRKKKKTKKKNEQPARVLREEKK